MAKIGYIAHILSGVRFKKIDEAVTRSHEISGKGKLPIFLDMCLCALKYGSGYYDYMMYGFFDRTWKERATYLTRVKNKELITLMNDDTYGYLFDNKNDFNRKFERYLGRGWLDGFTMTYEEFEAFVADKDEVFAKGNNGDSGKEVEKVKKADFADVRAMFDYIKGKNYGVIEECVRQHPDMNRLYPHAVNCLRVCTDVVDGRAHVAYVVLKSGNNGDYCDNSGRGGLICAVDRDTGVVTSIACDDLIAHHYDKHPFTGVPFIGFQVPLFQQALDMCREAALEVPQIRHVGWDVGISETGPVFIEGNNYPGTDLCQLYYNTPNRTGLLPVFQAIIPDFK